ncbi:hypothetical protein PSAB6_50038 [Paraburkholderia sabiae]|nr:hypothetical protein PSAB6_50038 [Paraburkholderia sabiae]
MRSGVRVNRIRFSVASNEGKRVLAAQTGTLEHVERPELAEERATPRRKPMYMEEVFGTVDGSTFPSCMQLISLRILISRPEAISSAQVSFPVAHHWPTIGADPVRRREALAWMENPYERPFRMDRIRQDVVDVKVERFRHPQTTVMLEHRDQYVAKVQPQLDLVRPLLPGNNESIEEKSFDLVPRESLARSPVADGSR